MKNIYLLLLIALLFACNEEDSVEPDKIPDPCLITRIEDQGGSYTTYQYDNNKRLTSYFVKVVSDHPLVIASERNHTIERDSKNRISRIIAGSEGGDHVDITTVDYDAQGRWIESTYGSAPDANTLPAFVSTTNVEYNQDGLISKATTFRSNGTLFYSLALEYEQKNLTKSVFEMPDFTYKWIQRYEYYLDKEAKPTEVDLVNLYTARGSVPAGASPSKNLLKRRTSDDGTLIGEELTYEFNEFGYPTKITNEINHESRNISYLCD